MNYNFKNKNGFSLLVAVITTSMFLIVSFVVANVALKQLVLSRANQESQYAFYNADSGTECAVYWDLKNPSGKSAFARYYEQDVTWTGGVNTLISGNSFSKNAGTNSTWDSGAISSQSITSGDGYVEFTVDKSTTAEMVGLSNGDSNQSYTDIDYAIFPTIGGNIRIYEFGSPVLVGGVQDITPYVAGDKLKVAIENGNIKYYKNGILLHSHVATPTYPLIVDTSIYSLTPAGSVSNAVLANTAPSTINCNGQSITSGQSVPTLPSPTTSVVGGGGSTNATSTFSINFPKGCAIVQVAKNTDGSTFISSRGYNLCSGTSVTGREERGVSLLFDYTGTIIPINRSLTITKAGAGSGTVTDSSGIGINCGSTCSALVPEGTNVSLTATPSGSDTFTGWSGACSGTGSCNFVMSANTSVTATFGQTPSTLAADYLIVAGGGGGGAYIGGGGGAGGVLHGSATMTSGVSYSIVVGGGGAGMVFDTGESTNGGNSVISGSDFTTSTAFGGGGAAGFYGGTTKSGGSGAGCIGAYAAQPGAAGVAGQGFRGGNGYAAAGGGGCGGGGATGIGGDGVFGFATNGGPGYTWLNGSTYGGGGAGGGGGTLASGGSGGGGDARCNATGGAGTPNTGGGGGAGSCYLDSGGAGGSGVIIIRYSGSPNATGGTITQNGGYTYHKFTVSGTFRPN
jgi:hypothetical protein